MSKRIQAALHTRNGGNQSELARFVGVSPQAVQKWIAGDTEPKGKNLRKAAQFLGTTEAALRFGDTSRTGDHIPKLASNDDDSMVVISCASTFTGLGFPARENEQTVSAMHISKAWVYGQLPKITGIDKLGMFTAQGDLMAPTINDGDLLLVDCGVHTIELDAIYVISRDAELFVKRVIRRLKDGSMIVKSDNPLYGPDDVVTSRGKERLKILGRVMWAWSGKRF